MLCGDRWSYRYHRQTSASTRPSPSQSKTGPEESNASSRITHAAHRFKLFLLVTLIQQTDFVPSQGVLHPLMISKKNRRNTQLHALPEMIILPHIWWYKDLGQAEPWPSPPTGTRPHTPGLEFCLWTPNSQKHMRDEGLS